VEDLLALNFLLNSFLLYLTARLTGRYVSRARLFGGGFIASLYSLAVFLPEFRHVYSWYGKLIVSVLLILFTYRPQRVMELMRLCGAFFLVSFFLAGTIFALSFFTAAPAVARGGVYYLRPPKPGLLFLGVLTAFLLLSGVWHYAERQRVRQSLRYMVTIRYQTAEASVAALLDTGNSLRDPLHGRPLCVISFKALKEMLPDPLLQAYESGGDPLEALAELSAEVAARFGVVSFRSLENAGLLVTFRPDSLQISRGDGIQEVKDAILAITAKSLFADDDIEMLLHPGIIRR